MTPDALDLARRLVAHPQWRRAPGMRVRLSGRRPYSDRFFERVHEDGRLAFEDEYDVDLDLADHATAGCLLAMVPGLRSVAYRGEPEGWVVRWVDGAGRVSSTLWCPTLGEAAARALLAAWGEPHPVTPSAADRRP